MKQQKDLVFKELKLVNGNTTNRVLDDGDSGNEDQSQDDDR